MPTARQACFAQNLLPAFAVVFAVVTSVVIAGVVILLTINVDVMGGVREEKCVLCRIVQEIGDEAGKYVLRLIS